MDRNVIIPIGFFEDLYGGCNLDGGSFIFVSLHGEPENIKKSINKLENKLKDKNIENGIEVSNFEINTGNDDMNVYAMGVTIFLITIINSTNISALWTRRRQKEIVLRKVFGAENKDIYIIFFGELLIISIISLLISFMIHFVFERIVGGFIGNMDIRLNLNVFLASGAIAILVAFIISLTSLKYITKIQPAEMLKED